MCVKTLKVEKDLRRSNKEPVEKLATERIITMGRGESSPKERLE